MLLGTLFVMLPAVTSPAAEEENPVVTETKAKLKDPSKPFTMFVEVKVKSGKGETLEQAFLECAGSTLKEPGCLRYEINRHAEKPNTYVFYEKWKNIDGLRAHIKADHTTKLLKQFPELFDGAPTITVYDALGN
jgi:quinol monooxygenase YgiN